MIRISKLGSGVVDPPAHLWRTWCLHGPAPYSVRYCTASEGITPVRGQGARIRAQHRYPWHGALPLQGSSKQRRGVHQSISCALGGPGLALCRLWRSQPLRLEASRLEPQPRAIQRSGSRTQDRAQLGMASVACRCAFRRPPKWLHKLPVDAEARSRHHANVCRRVRCKSASRSRSVRWDWGRNRRRYSTGRAPGGVREHLAMRFDELELEFKQSGRALAWRVLVWWDRGGMPRAFRGSQGRRRGCKRGP